MKRTSIYVSEELERFFADHIGPDDSLSSFLARMAERYESVCYFSPSRPGFFLQ
jgi:hypothetical protein